MSASLVGSEMCIRDRACGHPPVPAVSNEAFQMSLSRAESRSQAQAGSPVSYTHLTLPTICSV
eukprot:14687697-Alexandrium_andersonii.AAC.1